MLNSPHELWHCVLTIRSACDMLVMALENALIRTPQKVDVMPDRYPYNLDFNYGELESLQKFSINNLGDPFIESNYGVHSREFEVLCIAAGEVMRTHLISAFCSAVHRATYCS